MLPEGEHHHHHMHPTGQRWFDFVVPGSALLISVISLFLALSDGRTMERMADANARLVQANSWPFLQYTTSNESDSGPEITLGVVNTGVGPAKIESFEVFWDGQAVHDHTELLRRCCGFKPGMVHTFAEAKGTPEQLSAQMKQATSAGLSMSVIAPGVFEPRESQYFLKLPLTNDDAAMFHALNAARLRVSLRTCYCSVFDECWISSLRTMTPRPVRACPTPKVPYGY